MKILSKIIIMTFIILLITTLNSNAVTGDLTMISETNVKEEEEFSIILSISNLTNTEGLIGFGGKLTYSDNIELQDIDGVNDWESPTKTPNSFNKDTGNIAINRRDIRYIR